MTLEELLDQPPIDTITDAELVAILQPYFPITRPSSITQTAAALLAVPQNVQDLIAKHTKPPKPSLFGSVRGAQPPPPKP